MYLLITIPLITILCCCILLISFGCNWYESISIIDYIDEQFFNYKRSPLYSQHFNNYILSIHPDMYSVKVPNYKRNFSKTYSDSIIAIPEKYNKMLENYTKQASIYIKQFPIFKQFNWSFLMSINNLELNMPYTLDKFIILPKSLLEEIHFSFGNGHIKKDFIETLLHEQLHVIQRQYQSKFDTFYKSAYSMFLDTKLTSTLPNELAANYMSNPDSNGSIWIYKLDNKRYIPLLIFSEEATKSIGYNIDDITDTIDLDKIKLRYGYGFDTSMYHPNEIFACVLAEQLLQGRIQADYSKFMYSLK